MVLLQKIWFHTLIRQKIKSLKLIEKQVKKFRKNNKDFEIIFHLAGVNRPSKQKSSYLQNEKITNKICKLIEINNLKTKIILVPQQK